MQIDYNILPEILLYSTGFFAIYFFSYRKYFYSIVDPLFVYVFTLSFSSVLVIYVLADQPANMVHFFLCHASLLVGFVAVSHWFNNRRLISLPVSSPAHFYDYRTLRTTVYVLFILYALANITLLYTTGFALLNDDPTIAKVENFTKGFGIILKINWGVGGFIIAALLFFILCDARKFDFVLLTVAIIFTALEGSKASLLRILITFVLLLSHPLFKHRQNLIRKLRWAAPVGIAALLGVFFTVLFKENADSEQAAFAFLRRLLYGADSMLYFYSPVNEQYFAQFRFWDYIGHFLNPILAFLRLVPYNEAIGNLMVANDFPQMATGTIVGPNTPYYIEGQVFFGYYGAFIYSAIVGGCYAFVRAYYFKARYYSAFWLVLLCCICQQAYFINIEVTLFITQVFDTCFFVIPTYVLVSLVTKGGVRFRKMHL